MVGEVEDPETAADAESRLTRERRLRFYLRNGVLDTGVCSRVYGVDYRVLELPTAGAHAPETVRDCYTALYRSMLPHSFFQKHFLKLFPDPVSVFRTNSRKQFLWIPCL